MNDHIIIDEIDSTNDYAKGLGDIRGDRLTVIRAIRQTGGRGRSGKSFFSDHDGGLWVSVVSPIADISEHFIHNRAISLAILDTLKLADDTAPVRIKWPNDVYWGDKKIAGILLENMPDITCALIIGFGLNVNIKDCDFPEELRDLATSTLRETGRSLSIDDLLDGILAKYVAYRDNDDRAAVHKIYSDNLYRIGHNAAVDGKVGMVAGVEVDGRLKLVIDGEEVFFMSGTLRFV